MDVFSHWGNFWIYAIQLSLNSIMIWEFPPHKYRFCGKLRQEHHGLEHESAAIVLSRDSPLTAAPIEARHSCEASTSCPAHIQLESLCYAAYFSIWNIPVQRNVGGWHVTSHIVSCMLRVACSALHVTVTCCRHMLHSLFCSLPTRCDTERERESMWESQSDVSVRVCTACTHATIR